jgi:hypothetical protein
MLAPFPFKRKSERDTFLVDLGKLVENKIFQRWKLRSLRWGDGVDSKQSVDLEREEEYSWGRRARRGGRVRHTCRRHLMESLNQVRSKRRMRECIRDLRKNQTSRRNSESKRAPFFSLTLFFLSFRLAEFSERFERECRGSRNLFFILRIFIHSFILMKESVGGYHESRIAKWIQCRRRRKRRRREEFLLKNGRNNYLMMM